MIMFSCNDINFLRNIMYVKAIISLVFYVMPIVLIIMMGIDVVKAVIHPENGLNSLGMSFIKKLLATVLLFFVPSIVNLSFSTIKNVTNNSVICYNEATSENIEKIAIKNADDYWANMDKSNVTLTQISKMEKHIKNIPNKEIREEYMDKLEEYKEIYEAKQAEIAKKEAEERKKIREEQEKRRASSSGGGGSTGGSPKDKTIIVGDSGVVMMCKVYSLCQNNTYIAEIGEGYYWLVNTAIPQVNSKVQSGEYNIAILLGTNDVGATSSEGISQSNTYFNKVKSMAEGEWKKHNVVYVAVNHCNDPVAAANGYYTRQVAVDAFNKNMREKIVSAKLSNLSYCDTATGLVASEVDAGDGLHYNEKGASHVYNVLMNTCLKK